jgi:hypothetical protein
MDDKCDRKVLVLALIKALFPHDPVNGKQDDDLP